MIIHSFDDVLRQPKEWHSFEVSPGGRRVGLWRPVPWLGVGYFVLAELIFFLAYKLPVLHAFYAFVTLFFTPLVYWSIPLALVCAMMRVEFEGLSPHRWVATFVLYAIRPRRTLAGRACPVDETKMSHRGKIRFWHDVHSPRLSHGWIIGGSFSTNVPVRFTYAMRHRRQVVRPGGRPARDHVVDNRIEVRP
jgi:hypothetical protein